MERSDYRIYLASSWRNEQQPRVLKLLRDAGFSCYDFRNPPNNSGFGWEQICGDWKMWTARDFRDALNSQRANEGFDSDFCAMEDAHACVMLQRCGVSAALEIGQMTGRDKFTVAYLADGCEPELMLKMCDALVCDDAELLSAIERHYLALAYHEVASNPTLVVGP